MLFCITANYTPKAMEAMAKNPKTNRKEAVEKLLTAAGGKLVAMYGTIADGPGAMVIADVDPSAAPAMAAVVASSDAVHNVKLQRLFTMDEVVAIRQKRILGAVIAPLLTGRAVGSLKLCWGWELGDGDRGRTLMRLPLRRRFGKIWKTAEDPAIRC